MIVAVLAAIVGCSHVEQDTAAVSASVPLARTVEDSNPPPDREKLFKDLPSELQDKLNALEATVHTPSNDFHRRASKVAAMSESYNEKVHAFVCEEVQRIEDDYTDFVRHNVPPPRPDPRMISRR